MSVTGNFVYDVRPYSGYTDPSLPTGAYIAQGGIAGDASGGLLTMNFLFQIAEQNRITELFSLEQISLDIADGADVDVVMSTLNMDILSQARAASPQKWFFRVINVTTALGGAIAEMGTTILPLWLGSPNIDALGDAGGLRFQWVNANLRLYAITIQGYIWGPRSILAEGGPRRPVSGLFSR